ncbi:ATP-binding protein, partial [Pedobacter sp. ASV12]|uniref:ATP-binding protein n=1 Tax=Pedobacter sp. ASV12 TaxID=2795120 RepID=UPI001E526683
TEEVAGKLKIIFRDNGRGFDKSITDVKEIFKKGYSTTNSTGLGLYHINSIIQSYKWDIEANIDNKIGAEFIITAKK